MIKLIIKNITNYGHVNRLSLKKFEDGKMILFVSNGAKKNCGILLDEREQKKLKEWLNA